MDATLEFVGTATTVLRLGPFTLLTDPNFLHKGQHAYLGKGLFSKRLTEPSLQPQHLPPLDVLLLSHLHGDHFDRIARVQLGRGLPVLTTPPAARKLASWGFRETHGMVTWERTELTRDGARLEIMAAPGQHAPGPAQRALPPVMGTVLTLEDAAGPPLRIYITGDTIYRPWLREVADAAGPLDAMVIHLGGTRVLGLLVTMDGVQGTDLVDLVRPQVTVPIHYDDYTVFKSPLDDFLRVCRSRNAPTTVRTVLRGETVSLRP